MNAFYCGQDTTMCKSSACVAFNKVTARQTDIKHDKAGWWYGTWKMRQTKKCSQAVTKTWTEMTASVDFVFVYASNYLCVQFFCFQNAVEMSAQLWSPWWHPWFLFSKVIKGLRHRRPWICVHVSVCVSLTSDASETIEAIIIKLGLITASDMMMHHMLIILTLTEGYMDLTGK